MKRTHKIIIAYVALSAIVSCGISGGDSMSHAKDTDTAQSVADITAHGHTFEILPGDTLIAAKLGTIDLGRMREGETVRTDFSLVNRFGKPIVILDVRGSCGCVGLDTDLRPFADGEAKRVAVTYDSKGKDGLQSAMISVKTSVGDYKIELKADIRK